jgi:phage portal protein BeeE
MFTRAYHNLTDRLPVLRKPENTSATDYVFSQLGWAFQRRNKIIGVGWDTYYKAMQNVWVNACIQTYLDEIVNLGFTINNPDQNIVDFSHTSYLEDLFTNPMGVSSNDTYEIFTMLMWKSYLGLGDAFCEVIHDPKFSDVPIGLKHIPTEYMSYNYDNSCWEFINYSHQFEPDEIVHIKDPDIRGSVWGESNIDILAADIALEVLGRTHTTNILENNGLDPRGVLEYDSSIDDEKWNSEIARLSALAQTEHKTGTLIVRGGKYTRASSSNQDMEFMELMKDVRDRILATYGVPPAKVSIIETANLGSGSGLSQDKQFKKTLSGKSKLFEGAFKKVLGRSGFNEVFQYGDLDLEDKQQRASIEDIQIRNGSVTVNEVRSGYAMEPVDWGYLPLNYSQYGLTTKVGVTNLADANAEDVESVANDEIAPTAKNVNYQMLPYPNKKLDVVNKALMENGLVWSEY